MGIKQIGSIKSGEQEGVIGIWAHFLQVAGLDAEARVTWHNRN